MKPVGVKRLPQVHVHSTGLPLLLDRDRVANVDQHRVEGLGHFKSLIDGVIHEVLPLHADDAVVLSLFQQADSVVAHGGSVYAVAQSGRAAALDVAQNGGAGINAGAGLDLVGDLLRVADTLGNDDDEVALAGALRLGDLWSSYDKNRSLHSLD